MPYFTRNELLQQGFLDKHLGQDVSIATTSCIINPANLKLGDRSRIDDFCLIICTGGVSIGSNCRISAYSYINGEGGFAMGSYSSLSSRCTIYSVQSDFSGLAMVNPTVGDKYEDIIIGPVLLGRHVVLGTGTTVLPNVRLGSGVAIGAMSLVKESVPEWEIHAGNPLRFIKERSKQLLKAEKAYIEDILCQKA